MLGQIPDAQLELGLADLLFTALITQVVQRIAQGPHLGFLFVHGGQALSSLFRERVSGLTGCFQLRGLTEDSRFRFL